MSPGVQTPPTLLRTVGLEAYSLPLRLSWDYLCVWKGPGTRGSGWVQLLLLASQYLGLGPGSARPQFPNLSNGDHGRTCLQKVVGRWSEIGSVWAGQWCTDERLINASCCFYHWELCEVPVCRCRMRLRPTRIVYFLFPVRNITHDKFDNLDYLCWVTKIYDSCCLLFAFLLCHLKILLGPCNIWLEDKPFWDCVFLIFTSPRAPCRNG